MDGRPECAPPIVHMRIAPPTEHPVPAWQITPWLQIHGITCHPASRVEFFSSLLGETPPMATFVLVHGAWHGAWCWRRVARLLAKNGHEVFTPTLTGVGERSHLLNPSINVDTHILDVVNEMKWQELKDVVLVGHSYGGVVISG